MAGLSPGGLQQIWQLPVGATADGMRLQDQLSQGSDIENNTNQQTYDYNQQANPARLAQLQLQNQTSQAQLPGIQARSGMDENRLKIDNSTFDEQMAGHHAQLGAEAMQNHAKQALGFGQLLQTQGSLLTNDPMVWSQMSQHLREAGQGDLADHLDNIPADQRGLTMQNYGKQMSDTVSAYTQKQAELTQTGKNAIDVANVKGGYAAQLAEQKAASDLYKQEQRAQQAKALKAMPTAGAGKMSAEQNYAKWFDMYQQAMLDGKTDEAKEYEAPMQAAYQNLLQIRQAGKPDAIDLPATSQSGNIQTRPMPKAATGNEAPSQGPIKVTDEASYNSVPVGTQYVAPDGTLRTKK